MNPLRKTKNLPLGEGVIRMPLSCDACTPAERGSEHSPGGDRNTQKSQTERKDVIVMNKTQKRQLNLRNKLFAAIAMLLVSSIMMVSTTYAWFTLSTAPEVQGITTTVGANGNLEIALSPLSGNFNEITSDVGDADDPWTDRNLTWGNLLDLSDPSYRLDELTLLPSALRDFRGEMNNHGGISIYKGYIIALPEAVPDYPGLVDIRTGDGRVVQSRYRAAGFRGSDGEEYVYIVPHVFLMNPGIEIAGAWFD